jgi:hypothetical protein
MGFGDEKEVRVVDQNTGGAKGKKACQLGAIDPLALMELGRVAGAGAAKYDRYNYLRGYNWSLSIDAAFRHFLAMLSGEDRDPETGCLHSAMVAWHGLCLASFHLRQIGTDDRAPAPMVGETKIAAGLMVTTEQIDARARAGVLKGPI